MGGREAEEGVRGIKEGERDGNKRENGRREERRREEREVVDLIDVQGESLKVGSCGMYVCMVFSP